MRRITLSLLLCFAIASIQCIAQQLKEPWTEKQLMAPADLASILNNEGAEKPIIFSIGPGAIIKGSIDIGMTKEKANLDKLKKQLDKLPKNENIIIYCGCCPFEHCPNIRPAFNLLNKMKFTNHKLLNMPHNIKIDWINYNYPINQ